ncbi:MAG: carbohydrate kinase [Proteiniphilum sp.]|jgi:xylulokinase|nr:carbohydrate kinase [Proteiniphilum sp.]
MYVLGYDIGSSSIKAALVEIETGKTVASGFHPETEMPIHAPRPGWAEQEPAMWWDSLRHASTSVLRQSGVDPRDIKAIGISWQMHGLVLIDRNHRVLRPAIIWCDSRAVPYGENAFRAIGEERALSRLLNSPGSFTAAKLAWVKENEPDTYAQVYKIMLPGDYIAMKLTDEISVTVEGLSEGIFWDFRENTLSQDILNHFGFDRQLLPPLTPVFGIQGHLSATAAGQLGLHPGTPVSYRAGDQPNNAASLNVFNPGEIASTAGTSGVVYGVLDEVKYDPRSRVNIFAHVNHTPRHTRLGVLLCISGAGILNAWMRKNIMSGQTGYDAMNRLAQQSPAGARGISVIPFGNGAERVLENRNVDSSIHGISFNTHTLPDLLRAAQEGIAYSFRYGMEIMREIGMDIRVIRAGNANMYLSPLFREALACASGAVIELFDTDGAAGAAKSAGIGAGIYASPAEAFASLKKIMTVEPDSAKTERYGDAYRRWKSHII